MPTASRVVAILAWLRIVAILAVLIPTYYFFIDQRPTNQFVLGFREGYLEGAGLDPNHFSARDLGRLTGQMLVPAVLNALVLTAVYRRRRTMGLVAEGILLLLGLVTLSLLSVLCSIVILGLLLRGSVKRYCEAARPALSTLPASGRSD